MKKQIIAIALFFTAAVCAGAESTTDSTLASAIKLYKAENYSQCYIAFSDIVAKDPSNAVAYYYLAMTSAQIGKQGEAIENYQKVIDLAPDGKLGTYALKGKTCIESPDKCHEESDGTFDTVLDKFIKSEYGSGFTDEVRNQYEKNKIENLMREINRKDDISPSKFKEYKDFSSEVPTNDEIVSALRVLQRAGLYNITGLDVSAFSNSDNGEMLRLLTSGNASQNTQLIQALLTSQFSAGF